MQAIYKQAIYRASYTDEDGVKRVTAEELRRLGFPVPDSIPDVGNVATESVVVTCKGEASSDSAINLKIGLEFLEPFEWVNMTMTVPKEGA